MALLSLSVILSLTLGSVKIQTLEVIEVLLGRGNTKESIIILKIRMPRIVLGVFVGASLALAGSTLQGLFKNPMADPYIIGVSAGASLGSVLAIYFGFSNISIFAFLGALLSVFIVYNVARVRGSMSVTHLLLSGIAVGSFFSASSMFFMYLSGEKLSRAFFWLLGSLSTATWGEVFVILPYFFISFFVIFIFARDLNVMLFGEEEALSLGIKTDALKKILLVFATLVTASAVAVSGLIGFVGLVVPHITRLLVGPDHRILIPSCVISGGILLVLADSVARTVASPQDIPVGIITALFGAPFFCYLLFKRKKTYWGIV